MLLAGKVVWTASMDVPWRVLRSTLSFARCLTGLLVVGELEDGVKSVSFPADKGVSSQAEVNSLDPLLRVAGLGGEEGADLAVRIDLVGSCPVAKLRLKVGMEA